MKIGGFPNLYVDVMLLVTEKSVTGKVYLTNLFEVQLLLGAEQSL